MKEKELITILESLIKINTSNPPGNEHKTAKIVKKIFGSQKIRYTTHEKQKGRTNVIGRIGDPKKGPSIMINCHMDTVPAGNGWKTDPFKLVQKGDTLFGRGVCDNKGQLASMLLASKELKKLEPKLKGAIILVAAADEETGSENGIHWLVEKGLIKPDMGIIPDVPDGTKIIMAQKRLLHLKIVTRGKSTHGSTPHLGKNAITQMIKFVNILDEYKFEAIPSQYFNLHTMNIGTISGGNAINMVPDYCECKVDFRLLKNQSKKYILSELKKISKIIKGAKFEFIEEGYSDYAEIDRKSEIIRSCEKAITKTFSKKPKLVGIGGCTDSKALTLKGIPVADVSIAGKGAHEPNESVKLSELMKLSRFFVEVVRDILIK